MLFLVLGVLFLFALPIMIIAWMLMWAFDKSTYRIKKAIPTVLLSSIGLLILGGIMGPTTSSTTNSTSGTVNEETYKSMCQSISYDSLARTPGAYDGSLVKFKGQVIQVSESLRSVVYRINVTCGEYGFWTDTIYVEYSPDKNEPRILEGDIVMLYGEANNTKTYKAVLGQNITIPSIKAKYIDVTF